MRKVYIVSTKFIGTDHFFNPDTKTNETINCAKGCTDLYKRESDDIVVYGFNSNIADYPSDVKQFIDDLRQQLTREDDEVFFILHDKTLGVERPNYFYADKIIGFQHYCKDFTWHYLRDFNGTVQEFSKGMDYLFHGLKLYAKLKEMIDQYKYRIEQNEYLMNELSTFSLEKDETTVVLKKQLAAKLLNYTGGI